MHVYIFIFQVECLSVSKFLFLGFVCTFSATTTPLKKQPPVLVTTPKLHVQLVITVLFSQRVQG